MTDYEIMLASLRHLKVEHEWIRNQLNTSLEGQSLPLLNRGLSEFNDDIWDVLISECELLKTYGKLYESRTKIGINEVNLTTSIWP